MQKTLVWSLNFYALLPLIARVKGLGTGAFFQHAVHWSITCIHSYRQFRVFVDQALQNRTRCSVWENNM